MAMLPWDSVILPTVATTESITITRVLLSSVQMVTDRAVIILAILASPIFTMAILKPMDTMTAQAVTMKIKKGRMKK